MTKRQKLVPPGTRVHADLREPRTDAEWEALSEEFALGCAFMGDYNAALDRLREIRATLEAHGVDAYEWLARKVAHNEAVKGRTRRGMRKGNATVKANAAPRHSQIEEQLREASGRVKVVAIDRQASGLKASSDRTIRRVKIKSKTKE